MHIIAVNSRIEVEKSIWDHCKCGRINNILCVCARTFSLVEQRKTKGQLTDAAVFLEKLAPDNRILSYTAD